MLGAIRDRMEGAVWQAIAPRAPAHRRAKLSRIGLRPLRETWWTLLRHESACALWRHAWQLERTNEPRPPVDSLPELARVAVYTPGHLGDVLMTAPLLQAWRNARPRDDVTWLVGPWSASIARRYRAADRVETFLPAWRNYRRGQPGDGARTQVAWARRQSPVDVLITTAACDLATLFVGRALQPLWWSGRGPECDLYPVAPRQFLIDPARTLYEGSDLMRLLNPFGVAPGPATIPFPVDPQERENARRLLSGSGIQPDSPYVVIAPCAGWPGKQWPMERWAELADDLHLDGFAVVLMGTTSEARQTRALQRAMRAPAADLGGATTLGELAAVLAGARLWLGSDSGGMHLAAAVGTPTVALFGPTDPVRWAPPGPLHRSVRAVAGCPECVPWHPRARCVDRASCMKRISVQMVKRAAADHFEYKQ